MKLEECEGYKRLKESVERDIKGTENQDCFFTLMDAVKISIKNVFIDTVINSNG